MGYSISIIDRKPLEEPPEKIKNPAGVPLIVSFVQFQMCQKSTLKSHISMPFEGSV
jgi:hypothetical protein